MQNDPPEIFSPLWNVIHHPPLNYPHPVQFFTWSEMNQLHDHSKSLLNQLRNQFTSLADYKDAYFEFTQSLSSSLDESAIRELDEEMDSFDDVPDSENYDVIVYALELLMRY